MDQKFNGSIDDQMQSDERLYRLFEYSMMFSQVKRRGWLARGIPEFLAESTADHSKQIRQASTLYGMGRMSLDDISHMSCMADVHDICDLTSKDYIPADNISPEQKLAEEREGVIKAAEYFGLTEQILSLFDEFEAHETLPARVLFNFDKADAVVKSVAYRNNLDVIQEYYKNNPEEFEAMREKRYPGVPVDGVYPAMIEKLATFHPYAVGKIDDPFIIEALNKVENYKGRDAHMFFHSLLPHPDAVPLLEKIKADYRSDEGYAAMKDKLGAIRHFDASQVQFSTGKR